jgi:hypothetical protein
LRGWAGMAGSASRQRRSSERFECDCSAFRVDLTRLVVVGFGCEVDAFDRVGGARDCPVAYDRELVTAAPMHCRSQRDRHVALATSNSRKFALSSYVGWLTVAETH